MAEVMAADRMHIKYCRDNACRIEKPEDPGEACLNLDFLIRRIGKGSETPHYLVRTSHSDDYLSTFRLTVDLEEAVDDVSNPNLPGSGTVRPKAFGIIAFLEDDVWNVTRAVVLGPKVSRSTGNLTKRIYEVTFVDPLGPHSTAPEWTQGLCRFWENRLNGREV